MGVGVDGDTPIGREFESRLARLQDTGGLARLVRTASSAASSAASEVSDALGLRRMARRASTAVASVDERLGLSRLVRRVSVSDALEGLGDVMAESKLGKAVRSSSLGRTFSMNRQSAAAASIIGFGLAAFVGVLLAAGGGSVARGAHNLWFPIGSSIDRFLVHRGGKVLKIMFEKPGGKRKTVTFFCRPLGLDCAKTEDGLRVSTVKPRSHAEEEGVKVGWIIADINGQEVAGPNHRDTDAILRQAIMELDDETRHATRRDSSWGNLI